MTDQPLAYTSAAHQEAHQFLVEEAHLLDTWDLDAWLGLLTDDIRYVMPVRVTVARGVDEASVRTMDHFFEDRHMLAKRVERLGTPHAWTEDPPSRVRHFVTNVRTFATADPDELAVESALLLFRSRSDRPHADLLSASRQDLLRRADGRLLLARRTIEVDEAVLATQNLAVFL